MRILQVPYLSKTRIETYEQCPLKYHYVYEQGMEQETKQLTFGKLVHEVIERWWKEDHSTFQGNTDKDKILWLYRQVWPNYHFLDFEYFKIGEEILSNYVTQIEYAKYAPYVVAVEKEFELELEDADGNKIPVKGVIDLLLHYGDGHYHVFDWKTSVVPKAQSEIDKDIQLGIYNLAVVHLYPDAKKVDLTLWFLRNVGPTFSSRTKADLDSLKNYLGVVYRRILNDNEPQARFNQWCKYCPAKNVCPAFQQKLSEGVHYDEVENIEALIKYLEEIDNKLAALEDKKTELRTTLESIVKEMPRGELVVGGKRVFFRAYKKSSYDPSLLATILDYEDFVKVVSSVTKKKVDALLKEKPELGQHVVKALREWTEAPRLVVQEVD